MLQEALRTLPQAERLAELLMLAGIQAVVASDRTAGGGIETRLAILQSGGERRMALQGGEFVIELVEQAIQLGFRMLDLSPEVLTLQHRLAENHVYAIQQPLFERDARLVRRGWGGLLSSPATGSVYAGVPAIPDAAHREESFDRPFQRHRLPARSCDRRRTEPWLSFLASSDSRCLPSRVRP